MSKIRATQLEEIAKQSDFDVVIIGGGINGIGAYRELALQGLRVLLVERNDFASGCSAAPSRMIHGGLRYLENGEFDLVKESLRERDALLLNASHMVKPLPTTVPIRSLFSGLLNGALNFFGRAGKPAPRGAVPIKLGLQIYDWVCRHRKMLPTHKFRNEKDTHAIWPELNSSVLYSATYHDAWISAPERLCIELLQDTDAVNSKSIALNYVSLERDDAGQFILNDQMSSNKYIIDPKTVLFATGAWLDETRDLLFPGKPKNEQLVSGTKGSHLILDHPELLAALNGHMVFYENDDGRICIAYPFFGKVLAGATDIRVEEISRVKCEPYERDYILQSLRNVFPDIDVKTSDIVFSYSGIRPLPVSQHDFTGRISRGHYLVQKDGTPKQFSMVGGKWTTFRAFAEQAADEILAALGKPRIADTLAMAIGGGKNFPKDQADFVAGLTNNFGVSPNSAKTLFYRYGTNAQQICVASDPKSLDDLLSDNCGYSSGEITYLAQSERVCHLSDFIFRRSNLAITGVLTENVLSQVSAILASSLGWDEATRQKECAATRQELSLFYGVSPDMLLQRSKEI